MPEESYRLVQLPNGAWSVHSILDSETMHPGLGPREEGRQLYVQQLRIPERMRAAAGPFVIWDVGLGGGANALAALRECREVRSELKLISFDATNEALRFALQHRERLEYLRDYAPRVQQLLTDSHVNFVSGQLSVEWRVEAGDFPAVLRSFADDAREEHLPRPHAIFFDPFSPAKNPAMWRAELFADFFRALNPERPCALATYSRSTMVRVALLLAGFFVGRGCASGRKEETTIAANTLELIDEPLDGEWLNRARRSDSAEPLGGGEYWQKPLAGGTWTRLCSHPQFRGSFGLCGLASNWGG